MDKAYDITIKHPRAKITGRIVAKPQVLRFTYQIAPVGLTAENPFSMVYAINMNQQNVDGTEVKDVDNPAQFYLPDGKTMSVEYFGEYKPYNQEGPAAMGCKSGVVFYPLSGMYKLGDQITEPAQLEFEIQFD